MVFQLIFAAVLLSGVVWAGEPAPPPALAAMEALTAWNRDVPFEATARIALGAGPSRAMEGSYHLVRRDARTWRESIHLPGYRREIVARDGTNWVEQQGEYQPLRVFDIDELLDFTARHRETATGTLRRDKLGKGQDALRCFEFLCDRRTREICIDPRNGVLRDETYARRIRDLTGDTTIHYDDYVAFGAGLFPRHLTMTRNGRPVATSRIGPHRREHGGEVSREQRGVGPIELHGGQDGQIDGRGTLEQA